MVNKKQKWFYKGKEVYSKWIPSEDYRKFKPFNQVYGVCFTKDGKILILKDSDGNWNLHGGNPKNGESPKEILKRGVGRSNNCYWKMLDDWDSRSYLTK